MFSSSFLNGLYIIPILGVLIFVHEVGHFVAARMCGVKVEEFGIGIPPRMFGFTRKGVLWSINWIPFGGFVRVKGEDGADMDPDSMNAQPPAKRAFFLSAGVIMNLLLAIVLMIFVVGVNGLPQYENYIDAVAPGSPAAKAGWQPGDRIVAIDGKEVDQTQEIVNSTRKNAGNEITVTLERRGSLVDTTLTPRENPPEGEGRVGVNLAQRTVSDVFVDQIAPGSALADAGIQVGDRMVSANNRTIDNAYVLQTELRRFEDAALPVQYERNGQIYDTEIVVPSLVTGESLILTTGFETLREAPIFEDVPPLKVIPRGFQEAWDATKLMFESIRYVFTNTDSLGQVAGPVGMGQLTSELIKESTLPQWVTLANLAIILSLNLAFLNLLPLPALDGGRLLFVLIEVIRGKRIAPEKEGLVHMVGIVMLIGLMFIIAFNDIKRIIGGDSFLR
ncbi:MAG: site-2 protease family protein [Thermomicrobiales bacterium]|nr:site-2 protease family protein [Thermomicrobiales bacterium]